MLHDSGALEVGPSTDPFVRFVEDYRRLPMDFGEEQASLVKGSLGERAEPVGSGLIPGTLRTHSNRRVRATGATIGGRPMQVSDPGRRTSPRPILVKD